jgi:hypothetical protein
MSEDPPEAVEWPHEGRGGCLRIVIIGCALMCAMTMVAVAVERAHHRSRPTPAPTPTPATVYLV